MGAMATTITTTIRGILGYNGSKFAVYYQWLSENVFTRCAFCDRINAQNERRRLQ